MVKTHQILSNQFQKMMYDWIETDGINSAQNRYWNISENNSESYGLSESQLSMLGYYYLNQNQVQKTIEVFKLNSEVLPESTNVYHSLCEA